MYEYFKSSLMLLIIWTVMYLHKKELRKEMLFVSLFGMPLSLLEPLFVPVYWSPQSLFDLNLKIGFDIESLIFSFTVAGIASISYNLINNDINYKPIKKSKNLIYWLNRSILIIPLITILILYYLTKLNPIYSAFIGMSLGLIIAASLRPDLIKAMVLGGSVFTIGYIIFFWFLNLLFPAFILEWNFIAISSIILIGIPIEEIIWAFLFGTMMSVLYKYIFWIEVVER